MDCITRQTCRFRIFTSSRRHSETAVKAPSRMKCVAKLWLGRHERLSDEKYQNEGRFNRCESLALAPMISTGASGFGTSFGLTCANSANWPSFEPRLIPKLGQYSCHKSSCHGANILSSLLIHPEMRSGVHFHFA